MPNKTVGAINHTTTGMISIVAVGPAKGAINDKEPPGMIANKPAARAELGAIIETAAAGAQTGPILAKAVARAIIDGSTVDGIRAY